MKLGFICRWEKDRKNSWSGTHWGLYNGLKKYFDVVDIPVTTSFFELFLKCLRHFFRISDIGLTDIKLQQTRVIKKIPEASNVVFQFDECPLFKSKNGKYQFIYQDLNVGYLSKIAKLNIDDFYVSNFEKNSLKALKKRELYQNTFYNSANGIFTMGNWLKRELIDEGVPESKICHVGGGINIDRSKIDYKFKKGNKFLFVGKDFKRKNGDLVVKAFKLAKAKRRDIELYIVGPDNIDIDVDGVFCLGKLSYDELPMYFNMCDVFCMPSKFEAYGLVFAEALCYGLPCIGRNAYEMPYFIEDGVTGRLLRDEDPVLLSELMLDVLNNFQYSKNVQMKKDYYITEYSWDSVCSRIYNYIDKVVSRDKI